MECKTNPELTTNSSCKLSFINRTTKSLTVDYVNKIKVDKILGYLQVYHRYRLGYKLFLIDLHVNICDYLNGNVASKLLDIAMPILRNYFYTPHSNLTCPFNGQFAIRNLPLTSDLFANHFLPTGRYIVNFTMTTKMFKVEKFIWFVKVFFEVPQGKTVEDEGLGR